MTKPGRSKTFDAYNRWARLAPAVLAALPGIALFGVGAFSVETAAGILGLVVGAAGIVVCAIVRDLGRSLQPGLWASWGGSPAVARLRFRNAADTDAVARLHRRVDALVDFPLPTHAEEAASPDRADARYEEAVSVLRELTRNHDRFPLVFAENLEYGFRRNCLGLRPIGLSLSLIAVVISLSVLVVEGHYDGSHLARWLMPAALGVACAGFWIVVVGPSWVRLAAERYADRLFEAVVTLQAPAS